MKLVSDAYRELGKTFTNIGQGIVLAIVLAWLLKESASPWLGVAAIMGGILLISQGIYLIQKAHHKQKREEKKS